MFALCLQACATGSFVIVGEQRLPTENWETVTVTDVMPDGAQRIALVKAASDAGWTQQQSTDYALEELRKQAAKVGANTVVLSQLSTTTSVVGIPSASGTIVGSVEKEVIEGVAVYVNR